MRSNTTALLGLVVGLIGAVLVGLFVANSTGGSADDGEAIDVLVAAMPIPANLPADELSGTQVTTLRVPVAVRPASALTDVALLGGQRTLRPIGEGEILTTTQFGLAGPTAGGLVVEEGYEVMTVEAQLAPGVEGYVTPGDKVNVYATLTVQDAAGGGQPFTQLVLGHLRVLAVTRGTLNGQAAAPAEGTASQIVLLLEVLPEDVPVMIYAQQQGSLYYSIVNDDDPAPAVIRVELDALDAATREAAIAEAIRLQDEREALRASEEPTPAATEPEESTQ